MGLFLATVTGYIGILLVAVMMFIHYLRKGLDSTSSVKVDAKPSEKF
ncbi:MULTISPECIES: hypothetical protein [Ureibacillus]|nr:hypothetical protein [Ureibacillus thermosphaericus]